MTHERAHSVEIWTCGDQGCECPHLMLLNNEGIIFAEAVLSKETVQKLMEFIIRGQPQ